MSNKDIASPLTFNEIAPGEVFLSEAVRYLKLDLNEGRCFYQDDCTSFEVNAVNAITHEVAYIYPTSEVVRYDD